MAAPTLTEFLTRYPEFNGTSVDVLQGALDDAALDTPEDVWGTRHGLGVATLAAHLLATRNLQMSSMLGQQSGGVPGGAATGVQLAATLYGQERMRLWMELPYMGIAY